MKLSTWEQGGDYFQFNDHKLFYRCEGSGPAIILIHGFPTASWDWSKLWPTLTRYFKVVTLDLLGFGFSDKPQKFPYSIFLQADAVEALLMHLNITSTHVLAHDYGDTVAQELLARLNDQTLCCSLSSVTFLNGGMFPETHHPLLVQRLLMSPLGSWVSQFFTKEKLAKNFQKIFGPNTPPTPEEIDVFWQLLIHNQGRSVFHLLIRYMRERQQNRNRWVGSVQKASIPMLLINGEHDPISGRHMANRFADLIPNPKIVRLSSIGHYPQMEDPVAVLDSF